MPGTHEKLDNPVWSALSETHSEHALVFDRTRFYHPDYCPFGGMAPGGATSTGMDAYADLIDHFYIVGDHPPISKKLVLKKELLTLQMILEKPIEQEIRETIVRLGPEHRTALIQLINLVQPGYFRSKTSTMGNYFGIFKEGALVAVTGERMRMEGYTEVSGVVTHPEHTGRGYARQLITRTVQHIQGEGQIPFLHVATTNSRAIGLYERLGFEARLQLSFWQLGQ
ncbi:GNAT family N-acetyltransferase [Flavilitoribacter nigricans]|uniref:GNAT family N-acetyltransferase n=1 Tax=Flavilitoribacter nigricans (strain ATCC 23147 / DSM 23189 / NBRC 102662 / NCIMB 1420 / SS-2) TaxID=1122177 RepID=A0A2D0MYT3_FLAN2|nr:GNAT family N-acetyltransferase [Flavilitoribacter nigricans]PHN01049.1 GNAT family N-acetyltransferase [Flavilitoribacter nigricans DSM 23189 = NBRC 102662]